jgi:cholesterol transport system auxiliary component
MKHWLFIAAFCALGHGLLPGCALLSKADPLVPRYFTPENGTSPAPQIVSSGETRRLRLGTVDSGSQLRERMMFRSSAHELGYYEDRRWTERPEAYVRRGLVRVLYEERGLFRVVSGSAPTLDAELVAFEVIRAPQRQVRVQVVITLDDARTGKLSQTFTVDQAMRSAATDEDDADAAVEALAIALQSCLTRIADVVVARLEITPAQQAPGT